MTQPNLPNERLHQLIEKGNLSKEVQQATLARQMLEDPRARAKFRDFLLHWLEIDQNESPKKDPTLFPKFDEEVVSDLRRSLIKYLDSVVWEKRGTLDDLLQAGEIPLSPKLAAYYGIEQTRQSTFTAFPLYPSEKIGRQGLFTHPYLLAHHSYPDETSPIHRGVFVARKILGRHLRPPKEAISFKSSDFDPAWTMRQKVTSLTKPADCMTCHDLINSTGFLLEGYDATGRIRAEVGGKPLDLKVDYLDREGLSENTLVVYVTDNGWIQRTDAPKFAPRSKLSPYDGGLRTPIMLRQPGRIQPATSESLASSLDILPTVLAACGVPAPAELPGVNLLDADAVAARKQLFGECYTHTLLDLDDPAASLMWRWTVRQDGDHLWKLIEPVTAIAGRPFPTWEGRSVAAEDQARYERGEIELFDVAADPGETKNLAADHPALVSDLRASLKKVPLKKPPATTSGKDAEPGKAAAGLPRTDRPNLLVFLADDLGGRDLGCTGSSFYRTPAIDALAAAGMSFTRGYAACPVCSPTRAAFVTGRHPARVRITNFIPGNRRGRLLGAEFLKALPETEVTVPELLQAAGYTTGIFGKWHLGPPQDIPKHGFDVTGSTQVRPGSGPLDDPLHARAIARQAETFIVEAAAAGRPWFCYVPMHSVHVPLITRPELAAQEGRRAVGVGPRFDIPPPPPGDPFTKGVQDHPVYAGMIREMDETVAAVLAAVERAGQANDTLVVFTSDNGGLATAEGGPTSNLPFRAGKGFVYEGGIRVPLLVRWPGVVSAGSTTDLPVTTLDIAATLLDAAGCQLPADHVLDGASLRPVLDGGGTLPVRDLVWHYPHYANQGSRPAAALVAGDGPRPGTEKLVEHFEDGRLELFDLQSDPGERHDLAAARPERAKELHRRLVAWRTQVAAAMPSPNPEPVEPFGPAGVPPRK